MKYSFITNKKDFFNLLGVSAKKMNYILYNKQFKGPENMYTTFLVPKKNGGERKISAPNGELKIIQKKLATILENHYYETYKSQNYCNNITHAFQKNKGIITNAKVHRNKKNILNIDLEEFFHSIHFGRVKGFFEKDSTFKVPKDVALIIAQLTCYQGYLPQGAPTSPIISNLIGNILDMRLLKLCKKYKLNYTRYADDLTFSSNDLSFSKVKDKIILDIEMEIERCGFKVNNSKTRIQNYKIRQEVTGLTVNKKINVKRSYYKNTRAMANNLYRNKEFFIDNKIGTINQLEGRFSFINQLDKYNNKILKYKSFEKNSVGHQKNLESLYKIKKESSNTQFFKHLNAREKEYQKFLFYKYFYNNPQPLLATEGKTDIRYLKAALKNLYIEYPDLIEQQDGKFVYKIGFLNRFNYNAKKMNRLHYFLNILPDGASALKNIYSYYNEQNSHYPNYVKLFKKLDDDKPLNPVILLYDNELANKKKPILNFCNHIDMSENEKASLQSGSYFHISENLYLLTHQLINSAKENELEDLFDKKTLSK
ncbi:retron Ec67 family RNA-directed DNA polymerase/endonuclease, partial [Staphylococcus warneri]